MKSLYITGAERYSGKTATCLALGMRMQQDGYRVGYFKPLSLQPWHIENRFVDEDAAYVKQVLNLAAEPWELSPIVITPEFLQERLVNPGRQDLMAKVVETFQKLGQDKDVVIVRKQDDLPPASLRFRRSVPDSGLCGPCLPFCDVRI